MGFKQPITAEERLARLRENTARFKGPRLKPIEKHSRSLALCGFGPSLTRTWQDVKKCDEILTVSGAHDFLIERGIIPNFHAECDPREHKVFFVRNSRPEVAYYIASHCHPKMFESLRDRNVTLWHGYTDDDLFNQVKAVAELDGSGLIAGGTNVGMRALILALALGYRHIELHGFDCSYEGQTVWAGPHSGEQHKIVKIECSGRIFSTSDVMMQSTDDFFNLLPSLAGCKIVIHGNGLLEERVKIYTRDPALALSPKWWRPVDFVLRQ